MTTRNQIQSILTLAVAALATLAFTATSAHAATIFSEDFEDWNMVDDVNTAFQTTHGIFTNTTWPSTDFSLSAAANLVSPFPTVAATSPWLDPVPAELGTTFGALANGVSAEVTLADTYQEGGVYELTFRHFRRDDIDGAGVIATFYYGATALGSIGFAAVTTTDTYVTRSLPTSTPTGSPAIGFPIRIELTASPSGGPTFPHAMIDNVLLTGPAASVIPEPSTLALAALGVVGLIGFRGRRRNR